VNLDNLHCNVALQHVRLSVEQELEIDTGSHRYRETFTLTNKEEHGVGPREEGKRELVVNLADIHYEIAAERKKKGQVKAMSKEDLFMMS